MQYRQAPHPVPLEAADPGVDPFPPGMQPWLIALLRGIGLAVLVGLGAFVGIASRTHDGWTIALGVIGAIVTAFGGRVIGEGTVDQLRHRQNVAFARLLRR